MKRHEIIKAIISNMAVCLIALVFFVSSVFAWFQFVYKSQTEHRISVGRYEVDIKTLSSGNVELSVDLQEMYPMTRQMAYADIAQKHLYRFEISNSGNVYSMYRFLITATDSDDDAALSKQLKYSLRLGTDLAYMDFRLENHMWSVEDQYVFDDLLSPAEKESNQTLQETLDFYTVSVQPDGDIFAVYGEVKPDEFIYYDVFFWLSESATIGSANEDIGSGVWRGKTATLYFNTYFIQSVYGAKWPSDWAESLKPPAP